jgi:hypothetical protein
MIRIISLHIAKTAGTTFYRILQDEYAARLDHRTKRKDFFPDGSERKLAVADFSPETEVVHAHLRFWHVSELYREQKPFLIAWFRHPVERVISNYYFMLRAVHENPQHPHYHKRNYSLMEYVADSIPDKMSHYLEGIKPEKLDFIGLQESFADDLKALASALGWVRPFVQYKLNSHETDSGCFHYPTQPEHITTEMREEIARINSSDMELFSEVLSLRKKQ